MADETWHDQRERAIRSHAAAQDARRAAEIAEARSLLADFVRSAVARGLAPARLTAQPYGGGARLRTGLSGWYLRADHSVAVGTDGELYSMSAPGGLVARIAGVTLTPTAPRLIAGEGGRDGESMPLASLLALRLSEPV